MKLSRIVVEHVCEREREIAQGRGGAWPRLVASILPSRAQLQIPFIHLLAKVSIKNYTKAVEPIKVNTCLPDVTDWPVPPYVLTAEEPGLIPASASIFPSPCRR
jgi:hypothetical protein